VLNLIWEVDLVYLYLRGSRQFTPDYTNFFETIHHYGWPTLSQAWYPEIEAAEFQHIAPVSSITAWVDTVIHTAGKLARCSQLVMAGTLRPAPYKGPLDRIRQLNEQLRYEESRLRMEWDGQLLLKSIDLLCSGYEIRITGKD
jgi:hypothetical protein